MAEEKGFAATKNEFDRLNQRKRELLAEEGSNPELLSIKLAGEINLQAAQHTLWQLLYAVPLKLFSETLARVQKAGKLSGSMTEDYPVFKDFKGRVSNSFQNITLSQYKAVFAEWKTEKGLKYKIIIPILTAVLLVGALMASSNDLKIAGSLLEVVAGIIALVTASIGYSDVKDYRQLKQVENNMLLYLQLKFHAVNVPYKSLEIQVGPQVEVAAPLRFIPSAPDFSYQNTDAIAVNSFIRS